MLNHKPVQEKALLAPRDSGNVDGAITVQQFETCQRVRTHAWFAGHHLVCHRVCLKVQLLDGKNLCLLLLIRGSTMLLDLRVGFLRIFVLVAQVAIVVADRVVGIVLEFAKRVSVECEGIVFGLVV